MRDFWIRCASTVFFTGHFPIAPATFTSAIVIALWLWLPPLALFPWLALMAVLIVGGTWVSDRAERIYGEDGHPITIDEVVGQLLTVAFLPQTLWVAVVGFVLFRIFDIVKPPPAYQLQSLRGGYGIMADDVMAGIYAHLLLRAAVAMWPAFFA